MTFVAAGNPACVSRSQHTSVWINVSQVARRCHGGWRSSRAVMLTLGCTLPSSGELQSTEAEGLPGSGVGVSGLGRAPGSSGGCGAFCVETHQSTGCSPGKARLPSPSDQPSLAVHPRETRTVHGNAASSHLGLGEKETQKQDGLRFCLMGKREQADPSSSLGLFPDGLSSHVFGACPPGSRCVSRPRKREHRLQTLKIYLAGLLRELLEGTEGVS